MYEYEMEDSGHKSITVCMGMKWKRVIVRVSEYVRL